MLKLTGAIKDKLVPVLLAGAMITQIGPADIRICDSTRESCETFTAREYKDLKAGLADKVLSKTPLDGFGEYYLLHAMLNKELRGGRDIGPVTSKEDLTTKLINLLYEK